MINEYVVKKYCKDDISLIENFDNAIADFSKMWQCHHRREITTSRKDLIENNEYFNRPASELIFLTKKEHQSLHNKGNKNRLGAHHSEETKRKISDSHKGKTISEETKRKLSKSKQNRHWWNNCIKSVWTVECPAGFVKGRLKKVKQI